MERDLFKKKITLLFLILSLMRNLGLFPLLYSNEVSGLVRQNKPFLTEGDNILYFDIKGEKGTFKRTELLNDGYSLIIIFSDNCFSCNKNIPM
jgi:hypothetical protein